MKRTTKTREPAKTTRSPISMIEKASNGKAAAAQFYVPIIRDGPIERDVVREFSGLSRFEDRNRQPIPLVEIVDESDLEFVSAYEDMSGDVLIGVPYYLTERSNKYEESVTNLLEGYDNVAAFFNDTDEIDSPVLSFSDQQPINYGEYLSLYSQLSEEFEQVGIRLFIASRECTDGQRNALKNLASMISEDDIVLFDLVDVGGFRGEGVVPEKLEYLVDLFEANPTVVLNAFKPYEDVNVNYGPQAARQAGADGFGDFAINRRIERDIPVGNVDRRIRHYFPDQTAVNEFEGEDYETAQEKLITDPDWDGDHCEFCRRADTEGGHHRFWKEVRMGHYLSVTLSGED